MLLMSGFTGPVGVWVHRPCCYWCLGLQALLLLVCGSTGPVAVGVWVHRPCCYWCPLVVSESYGDRHTMAWFTMAWFSFPADRFTVQFTAGPTHNLHCSFVL